MRHDTAGDPISGIKWSRRTTTNISEQLTTLGIAVSKNTVGRLLKQMDFRLRVNRKQIATSKSPDRNQQFLYIGQQREQFASQAHLLQLATQSGHNLLIPHKTMPSSAKS